MTAGRITLNAIAIKTTTFQEILVLGESKMEKDKINKLRDELVLLRNECLTEKMDADGAVILSHAIRYLWFKIEEKPYEEPV